VSPPHGGSDLILAATRNGVARATVDAAGTWSVERPLTGQRVHCLAAVPGGGGDTVLVGTEDAGVLRSDDRGVTWAACGHVDRPVRSLAVSPHDPGLVYAGVRPAGILRTRDGAATWEELGGFRRIRWRRLWFSPAGPRFTAYVHAIALSPTDPGVVVAGIEFGAVVRSADGGDTWTGHRPGAMRDCHALCFHATDGAHVYEGGYGGAALSADAGLTWTRPAEGLDRKYGWAVAADPERPDVCYVAVAPGPGRAHGAKAAEAYVFRRVGARPWEKLGGGLPQPLDHMPYALVTDPGRPGAVTAGLANGDVWRSTDLGETWSQLPVALPPLAAMLVL